MLVLTALKRTEIIEMSVTLGLSQEQTALIINGNIETTYNPIQIGSVQSMAIIQSLLNDAYEAGKEVGRRKVKQELKELLT